MPDDPEPSVGSVIRKLTDIIGKSDEYLIRKFAEGSGQSTDEFDTPPEVGTIMSRVLAPEPGMTVYDPCCVSGGLLVNKRSPWRRAPERSGDILVPVVEEKGKKPHSVRIQ